MDETLGDPRPCPIQQKTDVVLPIVDRGPRSVVLKTLLFAFMVVAGQCLQNVVLPLFIDSGSYLTNSTDIKDTYEPFMDSYGATLFANIMFAIVFVAIFAVRRLRLYLSGETFDRRVPYKQIFLAGIIAGAASILIVYSSSGTRTAPYLQAILVNAAIPATLILRYLVLKKSPTKRKLICALAIVFAIVVCLLPSIVPEIDPGHGKNKEQGGTTGWRGIFWPCCFMIGYVLTAVCYILQERIYQYQNSLSTKKVDIFYIMSISMFLQLVVCLLLCWTNSIPEFGNVDSVEKTFLNFAYGMQCVFGRAGCSLYPALYGWLFVVSFLCYWIGAACLLRYSEGATFLAIVSAIVTPIGFLFWTLFKEQPTFHWHPQMSVTVWLNIGGLAVMVPCIYLYNAEREPQPPQNFKGNDLGTTPLLSESPSCTL